MSTATNPPAPQLTGGPHDDHSGEQSGRSRTGVDAGSRGERHGSRSGSGRRTARSGRRGPEQPDDPREHESSRAWAAPAGGTIRRRVARILALPAVVVLLLLSLLSVGQVQGFRNSRTTSASVKLALSVDDLTHELQTERGVTSALLGGNQSFQSELGPARAAVDGQRTTVQRLVTGGGVGQQRVATALQQLSSLSTVRHAVDTGKAGRSTAFGAFTGWIAALSGADTGLDNVSDSALRQQVSTLQALQDLTEATSQERAFLNGVFSASGFAKGEFAQFATMRADRLAALDRFQRSATPGQIAAMNFVYGTGAAHTVAAFEQIALNAADGRHLVVNPQAWWSGLTTELSDLSQLQQHVGSQIQVRAHDLQQHAATRIGLLLLVVLLCFAGSIYLTVLATRSITRPLAALAAEADSVAADRLPEAVRRLQDDAPGVPPTPPVPVKVPERATSEIRQVAGALDRLQSAAYGLATDQAVQRRDTIESMANLGRRNQNLIRRQLGFITTLEREEIDPNALANLFELDHLATRMRRNAASLLVLVGASSPRQWSSAVSVADMIRAAVSEVEEYRRVALRRVDDAFVSGSVVGSVAHLLAELVENGLTFSPPDMDVEVQGRRMSDGGYLIAITDQGVGMNPEDLRQANARLRGEGDFIAAPTRFLGHFVVGRLARDSGVQVELLPSPVTGITARITLPPGLLSRGSTVEVEAVEAAPTPRSRHSMAPQPGPRLAASNLLALPQPKFQPDELDDDLDQLDEELERGLSDERDDEYGAPLAPVAPVAPIAPVAGGSSERTWHFPGPSWPSGNGRSDPEATPPSGLPRVGRADTGSQPVVDAPAASSPSSTPASGSSSGRPSSPPAGVPSRPGWTSVSELASNWTPHRGFPSRSLTDPAPGDSGDITPSRPVTDDDDDVAARTRNGLRKRTPRTARAGADPGTGATRRVIDLDARSDSAAAPAGSRAPVLDSSPASVGARMTALRAGLQRGSTTSAGDKAPTEGSSGKDREAEAE